MATSDSDTDLEEQERIVLPVSQVVKPLKPDDTYYNEWPCYLLEDAVVYDKHGMHTSLLDVATKGPLMIEGRLSFEDDDELVSNLFNPSLKSAFIKVDNVVQFSFGTRDDSPDTGHVCMWGGEARHGWFEINPSEEYEPTYAKSTEAVNVYHFIQSLYSKKGASSLLLEDVLHRYASREGYGRTRHEVEAMVKSHADFLLCQMSLKEKANYPKTIFFNWLAHSCPAVVADLGRRKLNIQILPIFKSIGSVPIPGAPQMSEDEGDPEPYEPGEGEEEDSDASSETSDTKDNQTQDSLEPPEADIPGYIAWYLDVIWRDPDSKHASYFRRGLQNITMRNSSTILYTDLKIQKYFTATELLRLHAPGIRAALPLAWRVSELYKALSHPSKIESKGAEFEAAAREMTSIRRRNAMSVPRPSKPQPKEKKLKTRERSPGQRPSASYLTSHLNDSASSSSRIATPTSTITAPLSSRRTQTVGHKPSPQPLPPPQKVSSMSKVQRLKFEQERREAAITSGEGVTPPPRGKGPARKPITLNPLNPSSSVKNASRKRSHPDDEPQSSRRTRDPAHHAPLSPSTSSSSSSDTDSDSDLDVKDEPMSTTLTLQTIPHAQTTSHPLTGTGGAPLKGDEDDEDEASNVLAQETLLTGHSTPFLWQLLAEGRERIKKEREVVGTKVVPERIRGPMRREW